MPRKALPGPSEDAASLPDLQAALNLKGKADDVRRLAAIARIDKSIAVDLCRRALKEGSKPLQVKALELLPEVGDPGEAERVGLEWCAMKDRSLRKAALLALRTATSDAALDLMLEMLDDLAEPCGDTVDTVLAEMPHPKATARFLKVIDSALAALPPPPGPLKKGAKKAESDAWRKAKTAYEGQQEHLVRLVGILSRRKDDKNRKLLVKKLVELTRHPDSFVRATAIEGLQPFGPEVKEVLPALIDALGDPDSTVVGAAVHALIRYPAAKRDIAIPRLLEVMERTARVRLRTRRGLLPPSRSHGSHGKAILKLLRLGLVDETRFWLRYQTTSTIQQLATAARPLVPELLHALAAGTEVYNLSDILPTIDPEGTAAIPGLTDLLGHKEPDIRRSVLYTLRSYGPRAKSAVPVIEKLTKDRSNRVRNAAKHALIAIRGSV